MIAELKIALLKVNKTCKAYEQACAKYKDDRNIKDIEAKLEIYMDAMHEYHQHINTDVVLKLIKTVKYAKKFYNNDNNLFYKYLLRDSLTELKNENT